MRDDSGGDSNAPPLAQDDIPSAQLSRGNPMRFTGMKTVACAALTCTVIGASTRAVAIENARDAIATSAYEKNMRTLSIMQKVDADRDHLVTHAEVDDYFGKVFDSLDRDHDGSLDRTEWVGAGRDTTTILLSDGGYARALGSPRVMKIVDANADRKVTREEFVAAHETMFSYMASGTPGPLDVKRRVLRNLPSR